MKINIQKGKVYYITDINVGEAFMLKGDDEDVFMRISNSDSPNCDALNLTNGRLYNFHSINYEVMPCEANVNVKKLCID
jgi:hypothetical protein